MDDEMKDNLISLLILFWVWVCNVIFILLLICLWSLIY